MYSLTCLGQAFGAKALPNNLLAAAVSLQIMCGLADCFFGYRIFKIILGLMGFAVGAMFGGMAGYNVSSGEGTVAFVAGAIGGLMGAMLFVHLFYIGVFLMGAALGVVLTAGGVAAAQGHELEPVVLLVAAVIGGVIALVLQKLVIIVSTSFSGAWAIIAGLLYFFGKPMPRVETLVPPGGQVDPQHIIQLLWAQMSLPVLLGWLLLGLLGVVVQYLLTARRPRPADARAPQPPPKAAPAPTKNP